MSRQRGVWLGVAAHVMWGLFPLYWPLLKPAGAGEILAHRIIWSLVVVALILAVRGRWEWLARYRGEPRRLGFLAAAAVLIAINWLVYIEAVNTGHVVESSLGYFINPLVSVMLGVVVLGERMRPLQWAALGLAALAVVVLTVDYGHPPWIALTLAFSFGGYALMKKKANAVALEGLTVETAVLMLPALLYVVMLQANGRAAFGHYGLQTALLAAGGLVTAIPLLCFGAAVTRVPLSTMGVLQYVTPSMQFAFGVLLRHEPLPATRLGGFVLVWVALALFTAETIAHRRRQLRLTIDASAA